ncbi:MAG: carboxypeptidase-like regulatory domain-containing protein [Bacteroidota bacterium]
MKPHFRIVLLGLGMMLWGMAVSAQSGVVKGRVIDQYGRRVDSVEVKHRTSGKRALTDAQGEYEIELPAGTNFLEFRKSDYEEATEQFNLAPGESKRIYTKLRDRYQLEELEITDNADPTAIGDPDRGFTRLIPINPRKVTQIASIKSDLSSKLMTIGFGVSQNSEFSSQYRVRGGNFDENLIYVNDIEIYRPFLIRAGQQEGLGFVNPNLASEVGFSSGGFQPKYGDKMSSVLDVTYTDPEGFHGSAELGVLNQNLHLEGDVIKERKVDEDNPEELENALKYVPGRFTYLMGARRFTPSYVLNSLDTQGEYNPRFHDVQTMLTFTPRHKDRRMKIRERKDGRQDTIFLNQDRLKFSLFGNFANNDYIFTPVSRESSFGTISNVLRLRVAFQGQDIMSYTTGLGAFTVEHRPNVRLKMKYIFTAFRTYEAELFDVEGGYFLSDVNTNFGSEEFSETTFDRGIGTFFRHGRNYLEATVLSAEQRGDWFPGRNYRHKISWGLRGQRQLINDELREWNGVDSAGYFGLDESFRTNATLNSTLFKFYVQDHWKVSRDKTKRLILGARAIYNSLNDQFLVAPRIQFVIDPSSKDDGRDAMDESNYTRGDDRRYQLRFAAGVYHQPLFYREMRAFDGSLNTARPAQSSYHLIAGGDYLFNIWKRPFKFSAEGYFKYLTNLVPFEVDNVRIRYYPFENADGYAYGIDTRVTGEFIKGVDSWVNFGILSTRERLESQLDSGFVRRPTDQRLQFSMFFQDELPINPTYKVHINFVYGSGLRFGPPRVLEARSVFGVPSYQRVDLGFSKLLIFNTIEEREDKKFALESLWISAEIFNLFQRANTISFTWIQDVFNTQFAVPNFLSARLLNLRVMVRF